MPRKQSASADPAAVSASPSSLSASAPASRFGLLATAGATFLLPVVFAALLHGGRAAAQSSTASTQADKAEKVEEGELMATLSRVDNANAQDCAAWAQMGECDTNTMYMLAECARACGCREPPEEAKPAPDCVDRDKTGACAHWASLGECENNPSFTKLKCPSSCGTCDWLDYKKWAALQLLSSGLGLPGASPE